MKIEFWEQSVKMSKAGKKSIKTVSLALVNFQARKFNHFEKCGRK